MKVNFPPYKRPWYLFNGHLESYVPLKRFKIYQIAYKRERLELEDGDFLDLDWIRNSNDKLLILSHAFEGNSRDYFVERAASYFSKRGYDILMWHYRSCSKELNRLPRFYDIGDLEDLNAVIQHGKGDYQKVFLIGFSLSGATVINYLASDLNDSSVTKSAVFSTPLDLKETSGIMNHGFKKIYQKDFLRKWKNKVKRKAVQFPGLFNLDKLDAYKSLEQFHSQFTIKVQGYQSMSEYYQKNSSLRFLEEVKTPMLLLNAKNDPILGENSYPIIQNGLVQSEYPKHGGHLGFSYHNKPYSWMEEAMERWIDN